jgi:SulP family sulfate permease
MLGTFFLTVVFDLTVAVEVGLGLACVLFVRRMGALFRVEALPAEGVQQRFGLHGALFFGAVARMDAVVQAIETGPAAPQVVLDMAGLIALDTSGLDALRQLHKAVRARGGRLALDHLQEQPRSLVTRSGFAQELAAA